MRVHDVSAPLRPDLPVWPGDGQFQREVVSDLRAGDDATVSRLSLSAHAGTHMDAPRHFLRDGPGVETFATDVLVGPAVVVDLGHLRGPITDSTLEESGIPGGTERLLAKTSNSGWSKADTEFREDFIAFHASGAQWCVDWGVRLVGIDYLSIEPFGSNKVGYPAHKILLGAGVVIVEGLDLHSVDEGAYTLAALPLLVNGGDGAPARVVLIE